MGRDETPDGWSPAFDAVPRSAFLPDLMWPFDMAAGRSVSVDRVADSDAWQRHAEADAPIVTQWDDGEHSGTVPGQLSTSSASMPSVVRSMLRDLDVRPGQRVLEIGTGTGWNAALLAHRVGAENVVTVEVDEAVADAARTALEKFGEPVRVVHGDGVLGYREGAPYDRIIATCGLRSTPFAWVEQCRPGGVIVVPWGTHYGNGDAIARLVVADDGRSAAGFFTGPVEFMKLRSHRSPGIVHEEYVPDGVGAGDQSTTRLTEGDFVTGGRFDPLAFALGLRVPDCLSVTPRRPEGARGQSVWFYSLTDRSWASVLFHDGTHTRVWQSGPRRLWDEVEAAYRWWTAQKRPGFERFGLTVDSEGEHVWFDSPNNWFPA